jgi:predicted naringenin-chalcone synthase
MTWRIGNQGCDIVLSNYVPRLIGANIQEPAISAQPND